MEQWRFEEMNCATHANTRSLPTMHLGSFAKCGVCSFSSIIFRVSPVSCTSQYADGQLLLEYDVAFGGGAANIKCVRVYYTGFFVCSYSVSR